MTVSNPSSSNSPVPGSRLWRHVRGVLIFLFVTFNLVVLAIRNPLDLWYKPIKEWVQKNGWWERHGETFKLADRFTWRYTNLVGCEQRWVMFSPPIARRGPFLGFRLEFTDGTWEAIRSDNEPEKLTSFFRIGGWQRRKLEDHLVDPGKNLANDPERSLWEGYARHVLRHWKHQHPADQRTIASLVFIRRDIDFPPPDADPSHYDPPIENDVAIFDAEGRLKP
jgi:hypothetical protein